MLACAWEYARCVIPNFTNRDCYIAFCHFIIIGIIAELRGTLVDVAAGGQFLRYDLGELLRIDLAGTSSYHDMSREFRAFLSSLPKNVATGAVRSCFIDTLRL